MQSAEYGEGKIHDDYGEDWGGGNGGGGGGGFVPSAAEEEGTRSSDGGGFSMSLRRRQQRTRSLPSRCKLKITDRTTTEAAVAADSFLWCKFQSLIYLPRYTANTLLVVCI